MLPLCQIGRGEGCVCVRMHVRVCVCGKGAFVTFIDKLRGYVKCEENYYSCVQCKCSYVEHYLLFCKESSLVFNWEPRRNSAQAVENKSRTGLPPLCHMQVDAQTGNIHDRCIHIQEERQPQDTLSTVTTCHFLRNHHGNTPPPVLFT